jgi:hypothetical protein
MREEIQRIADAFLTPLQANLAGVEATMMPLLDALMVFVIAAAALSAAFRRNDMLGATWHCIFILGITQGALRYWPQLLEWSIGTAGNLTELGGAGQITDPFEIVSAGAALFTRAADHADVTAGYLPGEGLLKALFLILVGITLFVAYLIISAISLSAFVEFYAAGIVLAPLIAFLPVVGFTGAGFTPISFIMSATLRIAALGFLASFGTTLVSEYALPPIGDEITWLQALIAAGLACVLLFIAWRVNSMISGILLGRPGWSGAGMLTGAIAAAGGLVVSGLAGGSGAATASQAAGGGGGRSNPGTGSGGNQVGTTRQPVNSRSPAS